MAKESVETHRVAPERASLTHLHKEGDPEEYDTLLIQKRVEPQLTNWSRVGHCFPCERQMALR